MSSGPLGPGISDGYQGSRRRFSNRSKIRQELTKAIKPWREDFADLRKARGKLDYLCSRCQTLLPAELGQRGWTSSLPRILKHRKHCRLCRLLLKTLLLPEFDPFSHAQVANYLDGSHISGDRVKQLDREPINENRFQDWLIFGREVWPFGEGKAMLGEESRMVQADSTYRMSKLGRYTADLALSFSVSVVSTLTVSLAKTLVSPTSMSSDPVFLQKKIMKRHLPCYVEVLPSTIPGTFIARLQGYGRGPRAQLTTLSHFRLFAETSQACVHWTVDQPTLHYAFVLDPALIDISIGRQWLGHCEKHHGTKCAKQGWSFVTELPEFLRLIDVQEWRLVEFRGNTVRRCRYVALSYIWGSAQKQKLTLNKSNIRQLHSRLGLKPFLERDVPKTIRDAMLVVREMDERYLWVDALCIQQDDQLETLTQIESMHRVYGNAIVTLAAADSVDANAGIPGVLPGTRKIIQRKAKLENGQHLLVHVPDENRLELTPWSNRAWTLQEQMLSPRLMVFEAGKLTWRCPGMTAHEDLPGVELRNNSEPSPWLSIKPQYLGVNAREGYVDGSTMRLRDGRTIVVRSGTFSEYVKVIEQYTRRDMTYPGDVLNALTGLLRIFKQCFKRPISHGLPEALLDVAILWLPKERLKRREVPNLEFPSWSWAGWVGRVSYEKTFSATADRQNLLERRPVRNGEERLRPLVRWHTMTDDRLRAINSDGLGIPLSLAYGQRPIEWDASPPGINSSDTLTELDLPDTVLRQLDDTHLIFKTSVSRRFQFGTSVKDDYPRSPLKYSLIRMTSGANLTYRDPTFVGVLTLDGSSPIFLAGDTHALVVLSEAEYLGFGAEKLRDYHDRSAYYPLYNVMLVEWNIDGRIARRLGIGRVYKDAWLASGPYVQTVILE